MLSFTMLKRTLHAGHNSLLVMHLLDDIWLNFLCRSSVFKDAFLYFANPWIFLRNGMTSYGNNTNKTSVVTYRHFLRHFCITGTYSFCWRGAHLAQQLAENPWAGCWGWNALLSHTRLWLHHSQPELCFSAHTGTPAKGASTLPQVFKCSQKQVTCLQK